MEIALSGVITLYPDDQQVMQNLGTAASLFVPHMPEAELVNMSAHGPKDVNPHRRALIFLANRAGGPANFKTPRLGRMLGT